jgi:FkbM family methyltransferase
MTLEDIQIEWNDEYRLWWPNNEEAHVYKTMLMRVTDIDTLVKYTRTLGVCVQAGGFIGMWPARLAKFFERVYTFEPIPHLYECVRRNTNHLPSVRVYNNLLGNAMGDVKLHAKRNGCTAVHPNGEITAKAITIDSLALIRCDAIYLDVEQYELDVLDGARNTIVFFQPTVMLEIKGPDTSAKYDEFMRLNFRYKKAFQIHSDRIYVPE